MDVDTLKLVLENICHFFSVLFVFVTTSRLINEQICMYVSVHVYAQTNINLTHSSFIRYSFFIDYF